MMTSVFYTDMYIISVYSLARGILICQLSRKSNFYLTLRIPLVTNFIFRQSAPV